MPRFSEIGDNAESLDEEIQAHNLLAKAKTDFEANQGALAKARADLKASQEALAKLQNELTSCQTALATRQNSLANPSLKELFLCSTEHPCFIPILGPSASGKTFSTNKHIQALFQHNHVADDGCFISVDGGKMREVSKAWKGFQSIMKFTKKAFPNFIGFKDLYKKIQPHSNHFKSKLLEKLQAERINILYPDTAPTCAVTTKILCKVYNKIEEFSNQNYKVMMIGINASKEQCREQGNGRALKEGKIYSGKYWENSQYAMREIMDKFSKDGLGNDSTSIIVRNVVPTKWGDEKNKGTATVGNHVVKISHISFQVKEGDYVRLRDEKNAHKYLVENVSEEVSSTRKTAKKTVNVYLDRPVEKFDDHRYRRKTFTVQLRKQVIDKSRNIEDDVLVIEPRSSVTLDISDDDVATFAK
eukprot:g10949.t1